MARCVITLLGGIQITLDGSPLHGLESNKVRALLAYLAAENSQPHERERLAGLFWPEMPEAQARARLSQSLYNLRQVFGEPGKTGPLEVETGSTSHFLLVDHQSVQFNPHSDHWLDVCAFEQRLAQVRRHTHTRLETCESCAGLLHEAAQLYSGDFLSGVSLAGCQALEEWALVWREKLHRQLCEAYSDLVVCYEAHNELRQGLEAAGRWVHLDPLSEPALRKLMRLLALDGQRTQALARYHSFRRQLACELGVEPGKETRLLYEHILAEENALTNLPGMPGALPVPLTPFIGRDKELTELIAWLRQPAMRLVTILGSGGCGKSRLALQAAHNLRYDYPDGIFFVSLSGLSSPDALLPALAHALGVVFQASWGDPFEQLSGFLQPRRLLLLLDSFEDVLVGAGFKPARAEPAPSATSLLMRLLQAAPGVQVLVTSRARLNVQPEQVFHLEGMRYPDLPDLEGAALNLEDYPALQLFHSAARLVRPDYTHTTEDLPHLVRICQLVEGMPLGLLLAAGWLETLSPQEIAEEIERSLDFLSSAWSDVPERQRSLRATLDHSWRLLEEDDQKAFQRLSVFQRSFTRPAAEQVAQVDAAGLRRLADRSMLLTAQGLYRMHDLLLQYAAEKLSADEAEAGRARKAHCAYFLERLTERTPRLKSAQRSVALREIDSEINDIQAAWEWACAQADIPLLASSLEGLCLYYEMRVRYHEGERACQEALAIQYNGADHEAVSGPLHASLLLWWEHFLVLLGQLEAARQLRQQTAELLNHLEAKELAQSEAKELAQSEAKELAQSEAKELAQSEAKGVDVRQPRAMLWHAEGDAQADLKVKIECYQRGIALYRELGDDWRLAAMLCWAGELVHRLGDAELCLQYQEEALRLCKQVGEPNGILSTMIDITYIYFILNQLDTARQFMQETSKLAESMEELPARSNAQLHLGTLLGWSGRFPESIDMLERALPLLRSLGYRYGTVYGSLALGVICVMNGEYARGETLLQANLSEAEQGGFPREAASTLLGLGMAALAQGRVAQALEHFQDSIQRYRQMQFKAELGWALGGLALALETDGQSKAAQATLVEALQIAEQTRSMFTMFTCLAAMVRLLYRLGRLEAALLVERVRLAQPAHRNLRWDADMIGNELPKQWENLPEARRTQIDASASQHTPFTIIPEVLKLLG